MNKDLRRPVIAGNWKMNKTPSEATVLINEIKEAVTNPACDVVVCVPYVCLANAVEAAKGSFVKVGAQNMHFEKSGAFTGEISADMLKEIGVEYVVIGHSERREYFGETDETVNKKVKMAIDNGLKVILCCGETLKQREQGITKEFVKMQVKIALGGVGEIGIKSVIIAYEPIWAIGTGKTATSEQANEVNGWVREAVEDLYGKEIAEATVVQYGGSMNPSNAVELLSKYHVDGGLIGGASLKANDFKSIIEGTK